MKMEHEVRAASDGVVAALRARRRRRRRGGRGRSPCCVRRRRVAAASAPTGRRPRATAAALRADLLELRAREALLADASRPEAVARRHALGLRTARENIADLCDAGSFVEYGALAFAAQRSRPRARRPDPQHAGRRHGHRHRQHQRRAVRRRALARRRHGLRRDRARRHAGHAQPPEDRPPARQVAREQRLPVVLFAEGGGGRPGDVDMPIVAGLHVATFASFARLSGQVPLVGIVAGRCFAGNAALLGCCDVDHRDRGQLDRHGRPGDGRRRRPRRLPARGDRPERGAVALRRDRRPGRRRGRGGRASRAATSSFFQGRVAASAPADPTRAARRCCRRTGCAPTTSAPSSPRSSIAGSALELRAGFGAGIVTALARIEGRPVGLLASNPAHLGGAIDADAADKAARFMQLCDAHGAAARLADRHARLHGRPRDREPRPGAPRQPDVRRRRAAARAGRRRSCCARPTGSARWRWPRGGMHAPMATVAWPSGEFGAMGLEGAVELGYRKELAAAPEGAERDALARAAGRGAVREGQGDPHGGDARDRRGHRPGRHAGAGWPRPWTRRGCPSRAAASSTRGRRVGPVARLQRRVGGFVAEGDLVAGIARADCGVAPERAPARYQRFTSSTHSSSFAMIFPCGPAASARRLSMRRRNVPSAAASIGGRSGPTP